jgi:hypothetical protein
MDREEQLRRRLSFLDTGATGEERYLISPYLFMERYLNTKELFSNSHN